MKIVPKKEPAPAPPGKIAPVPVQSGKIAPAARPPRLVRSSSCPSPQYRPSRSGSAGTKPEHDPKVTISGYKLAKTLSKGEYSTVYLGLKNSAAFTLKIMPPTLLAAVKHETEILKRIKNLPGVATLVEELLFSNARILVLNYVPGQELYTLVETCGALEEDLSLSIFQTLVDILAPIHAMGIVHRDLKMENIIISMEQAYTTTTTTTPATDLAPLFSLTIIDWGFAFDYTKPFKRLDCGSVAYCAPEVFTKEYAGPEIDVWSLGVILYILATGQLPFANAAATENYQLNWYAPGLTPQVVLILQKILVPRDTRASLQFFQSLKPF